MPTWSELRQTAIPLSTGASAVYPATQRLMEKYVFTSRFGDEVPLYTLDAKQQLIHLPRELCPIGRKDERVIGEAVEFPTAPVPRDYQRQLFNDVAYFLGQGQSGIVTAFTGFGKTVIGYHAAYSVGRKTLVITTKDDIYKQWIDGACGRNGSPNFLGLTEAEVGEIRGDKCEVVGAKFCVAMIHSLSKAQKYPDWITKDFGLVIFDECHRVPAEQFSAVADMFPALLRLGLSATPERSDGKELLIHAHIGPVRAETDAQLMVPKVLRFKSGWVCPRTLRHNKDTGQNEIVRIPHQPGKTMHIEKMLAADQNRNQMVAELIGQALEKGRNIVVFSTLHDHLHALHRLCIKSGISGRKLGFYLGATSKQEKEHREREKVKPVLFTTYGMMAEGTNLPWLDTCILAMPRSKVNQPVGRIRREYPDKSMPVVMDIMDSDSPIFAAYAAGRARWYGSIGCTVKAMN